MDVFKLLSKSAKASQSAATQKLPSTGEARNPQLFGHNGVQQGGLDKASSRKRKRGQDIVVQQTALPTELDFFNDTSRSEVKKIQNDSNTTQNRQQTKPLSESSAKIADANLNDDVVHNEEERRRILRSHKLKITVLDDFTTLEASAKLGDKSSKKRKRATEKTQQATSKKTKTQLYPEPLTSFRQLRSRYGVSRRLAENVEAQGYSVPTEVQLGVLPLLLGGAEARLGGLADGINNGSNEKTGHQNDGAIDLLTIAPTGSGKTIAFLVPLIDALLQNNNLSKAEDNLPGANGPRAIIIAPTKELAGQIVNEARKLASGTGIKAALMKKGMEVFEQSEDEMSDEEHLESANTTSDDDDANTSSQGGMEIAQKPQRKRRRAEVVKAAILVATPLALLNALRKRDGRIEELLGARYLILDEADVLLDPLFREQTLSIWNACSNPLLRVSLWSATMGSNIEELAIATINNRWRSISSSTSLIPHRAPLIRLVVGLKDTAIPNVNHKLVYAATEQGKLLALRQLLHPTAAPSTDTAPALRPPFLIFTQTIPRAIALHAELLYDIPPEAGGSSRIAVLHADLPSTARDSVMARFRRGEIWVLITTDLLARGVDFRGLNGVVNYDVPNSAAAYVHRVGRTGRAGREGGVAVTLYTQEDIPYIKNVANVIKASEKLLGKGEDEGEIKQWLLDALPTPKKRDRQRLKKRGVEARRPNVKGDVKAKSKTRISTKSGWERRTENNKRGAVKGSQGRRMQERMVDIGESDFEGFEE